ncbi:DMT family transporter [Raoultibacter timonensis]|uniref:Transporter n=1 Tax=Raoultibacter timonensis TaxID=1907662 RepID=A0ABM7WFH1_9ACTN|nr:DMT family transporter [Raoultibacter timonensis]BDE94988.1 transporter [Raoultibacter timonensis]BDF49591.1 transporter [Raoultibacter timonensis]
METQGNTSGSASGNRVLPSIVYKLMIVAATVIWGLSFVVMKDAVDVLPPSYLIGVRFLSCGLILAVIFFKKLRAHFDRGHIVNGCFLGLLIYLAFWIQTIGLTDTTPGKNAFLTATYCVLVPFIWWFIARKRPTVYNIAAAVLCIAGVGLVSLQGSFSMRFGDYMTLLCALVFAVHIVYVAKLSEGRDILVLTVWQFLFGGVCGMVVGACFEAFPPVEVLLDPAFLFNMAYLVIFASCVALVFQNVALAHVPPAQGSLFLSLESVFGVLFSVALYGEELTFKLVAGFCLIFVAILVSEMFPLKGKKQLAEEPAGEAPPIEELRDYEAREFGDGGVRAAARAEE